MKRKLLPVAMAVVMVLVCLTGCSGEFSKSSFISAAKSSGMKEIVETTELSNILADPGEHIAYYYDMDIKLFEFLGGPLRDYVSVKDVKECTMAIESIGKTDDHVRAGVEEGVKNGVMYTVSYQGPKDSQNDGSTVELACGVYLRDNQIFWIRSDYYANLKNKTVENFCKSLGLVSPYTRS